MDSSLLKVFMIVAEQKSISLASKELKCAQSNVTARIKQLEKSINQKLFHRVPKGVVLTKVGEKLLVYAKDIVKKLNEAEQFLKHLNNQGKIKIGSTETNAALRIVEVLSNLHKNYPDLELELVTGSTESITNMLIDYKIDVAFVTGEPKHKNLKVIKEYEEEVAILEPIDKPSPKIFLSLKDCAYQKIFLTELNQNDRENYRMMEFASLETVIGCVSAGMGITLLPIKIAKKLNYIDKVKITKVDIKAKTSLICQSDILESIEEYFKEK